MRLQVWDYENFVMRPVGTVWHATCITLVWCLQVTLDEADALLRELETHSDVEAMDTWSNGDTTEQDKDMSTDSAKVEPQQSTDGLDEIDK